jgi:beta-N-acetylhexosaminidase
MSTAAGVLLPGFVGTTLPDWLAERLRAGLAGVCLFGENIVSRAQLRAITDEIRTANPLAIIAIDEEGGDVTRLYYDVGSPYPGNAILGRLGDPELTERVARAVGRDLVHSGVNLDLAPDADINSNPDNPVIGVRSFGTAPAEVARHSAAWVTGLQSTGVAASVKHFPGHGDTAQDSHLALPVVDRSLAELRERELVPFVAAIAAGTKTIMTSHILLPQLDAELPATFSRRILQEMLRLELGFEGVIVSDALDMVGASGEIGIPRAAVSALSAGCDLLCIGTRNTDDQLTAIEAAIDEAITAGEVDAARLDDAVRRVAALAAGSTSHDEGEAEPEFDPAVTATAFDVVPGVAFSGPAWPVAFETTANIAVGAVPWGPFASGVDLAQVLREGEQIVPPPEGAQLVLIGRDNHRYGWVRALVDEARARHPLTVVVDMGWPSDDRAYADIATFGASRHVTEALRLRVRQLMAEEG